MKLNEQPINKQTHDADGILSVHSIFPTIQGEGVFVGAPAVFVRLEGCNLQCPQCDTDYTSKKISYSPDSLLAEIKLLTGPSPLVVITGGEPFRQNLLPLINLLLLESYTVQIETNGTLWQKLPFENESLIICCSPKTGKINQRLVDKISFYKYVLHADHISDKDGLPLSALGHTAHPILARPPEDAVVYVQPIDVDYPEENKRHLDATISSCMKYGYMLGLQIHKIIGME